VHPATGPQKLLHLKRLRQQGLFVQNTRNAVCSLLRSPENIVASMIYENNLLRKGGRIGQLQLSREATHPVLLAKTDPGTEAPNKSSPWRFLPVCNRSAEILDNWST